MVRVVVDEKHAAKKRATIWKLVIVTFICFALFTLRGVMFMLRPAWNITLPQGVFYALAYMLPEILACIAEVFVIISTHESRRKSADSTSMSTLRTESTASMDSESNVSFRPLLGSHENDTMDTEETLVRLDKLIDRDEVPDKNIYSDISESDAVLRSAIEEEAERKHTRAKTKK